MPSLTVTPQYGDDQASAPIFTTLRFHVLSCSLLYQWIILASPISDTRIHYTWEFGLVYTVVPVTTDLLSLVCPLYGDQRILPLSALFPFLVMLSRPRLLPPPILGLSSLVRDYIETSPYQI